MATDAAAAADVEAAAAMAAAAAADVGMGAAGVWTRPWSWLRPRPPPRPCLRPRPPITPTEFPTRGSTLSAQFRQHVPLAWLTWRSNDAPLPTDCCVRWQGTVWWQVDLWDLRPWWQATASVLAPAPAPALLALAPAQRWHRRWQDAGTGAVCWHHQSRRRWHWCLPPGGRFSSLSW